MSQATIAGEKVMCSEPFNYNELWGEDPPAIEWTEEPPPKTRDFFDEFEPVQDEFRVEN